MRRGQKSKEPGHTGPLGLLAFMEVKWENIGIFWAEVWHDLTVSFYRTTLATALRTDWNGQGRQRVDGNKPGEWGWGFGSCWEWRSLRPICQEVKGHQLQGLSLGPEWALAMWPYGWWQGIIKFGQLGYFSHRWFKPLSLFHPQIPLSPFKSGGVEVAVGIWGKV